ncbi:CpsD/CapB family tyrosine-protein kinase [Aquisphaera insulae]|uniref:CpsD/CapB family tyrosine-protein kinase n=1 Tax=Aquisphaera insulae TaxID=2712864 RepID=UPI0013EDC608|nr:CpsD/CapB family tyrosine-protein kinase [Aquisphaera insulae]
MKEVDDALSRAFAQRSRPGGDPVPPRPHRAVEGGILVRHRPVESHVESSPAGQAGMAPGVELRWPLIVQLLEQRWGERFEQMADRLIEARDRQNVKALLFTSCHRAEGRTTLVLTLARALARRGGRTLLVDADVSGPMLSRSLGFQPANGLDDVVEEGHALADAILAARDDHLWVLPLRTAVSRPREFLAGPTWTRTVARLRREFDLILIDGSPIFTGLSAAAPPRSVDAAVLVYNPSMTGERSLLRAREVLDSGGIPVLGLAETFV